MININIIAIKIITILEYNKYLIQKIVNFAKILYLGNLSYIIKIKTNIKIILQQNYNK